MTCVTTKGIEMEMKKFRSEAFGLCSAFEWDHSTFMPDDWGECKFFGVVDHSSFWAWIFPKDDEEDETEPENRLCGLRVGDMVVCLDVEYDRYQAWTPALFNEHWSEV
jgi:hypothetical protein